MSASVLKTVKCGRSITAAFVRQKHTLITGEGRLNVEATGGQQQQPHQQMHQVVAAVQPASLPPSCVIIPPNVEELQASEKAQFSPRRTRDTSSAHIAAYGSLFGSGLMGSEGVRNSGYNLGSTPVDCHVDVYDCRDPVTLDSLIQTNVPQPYEISSQAPSQFSSPDCYGAQDDKYVAGDLQDHHQSTHSSSKKTSGTATILLGSSGVKRGMLGVKVPFGAGHCIRQYSTWCYGSRLVTVRAPLVPNCPNLVRLLSNNSVSDRGYLCARDNVRNIKFFHTCRTARVQEKTDVESKEKETSQTQLTSRQKLQRAVKEYGSTVIVFHVIISLASLGFFYLLVSSGVDMTGLIKALGINLGTAVDSAAEVGKLAEAGGDVQVLGTLEEGKTVDNGDSVDVTTKTAAGAATFVVAYAVHKVFAPARIGITLTSTPFIVRYLRRIGFLKPPKPKLS